MTAPWHAISADDVLARLETGPHGLSTDEAQRRLERYGPNAIRSAEGVSPWTIFLHQFISPLIYVLLVAALVTLVIGHYADSIVIALVLALNATIGFIQEYRAEHAMQALMGMVSPRATVRRDGERLEIDSSELVPGDLVLLESGDLIPADLRIVEESELRTDDSILTGESVTVGKTAAALTDKADLPVADRRNLAFMGTAVASGRAKGVVVATGAQTQMGTIAGEIRGAERAQTPLQERMKRFGRFVSAIIVVVCGVAFLVGLWAGIPAADMFLTAVAIAVAAIPEGLPIVMTVALAVSVRRMARRNAIVRRLPAVETLGSCTVIMSDKTGTLTENRMTVQRIWTGRPALRAGSPDRRGDRGATYTVSGAGLDVRGDITLDDGGEPPRTRGKGDRFDENSALHLTLLAGMLANEADVRKHAEDHQHSLMAQGDPTEVALLVAAIKGGMSREDLLDAWPRIVLIPFESERQFSASINKRVDDGRIAAFLKGAPERVLRMCATLRTNKGDEPLDETEAVDVLEQARRLASEGLRVLAMAIGESENAVQSTRDGDPQGLTFLGLVGMMDPPRPEVIDAVANCHRAGIRVIMVTGDHAATAATIAEKIGMHESRVPSSEYREGAAPNPKPETRNKPEARNSELEPWNHPVITGSELEEMSDADLRDALPRVSVYARVSPHQKLRIVKMLREIGEVVAVTGDGVNDAPALKSAHIGCAMGISGTDVAKEASELVLADDNFATIYAAVEEGRTVFSNIRKATDFLLSTSVGVVLAIFGTFALAATGWLVMEDGGVPLLMLPAQILWLNVVTNGIQDVALAFEPGEEEQYLRPPRDPSEGLLSRMLMERTIIVGVLLAIVGLGMFTWELGRGSDLAYAQAATLTALVIFKMLHVGACRSETLSIVQKHVFSNPVLFIGTSVSLAVHLGAMHFGPTQFLLGLEPLSLETWLAIVIAAPSVLVVVELHKMMRKGIDRPK